MHILIIEDEEQLCRSVAEGLRIDGYETDICFDGDEGLCLCMTENYDLILLDLNLPGTDGLEILRQFREQNTTYTNDEQWQKIACPPGIRLKIK